MNPECSIALYKPEIPPNTGNISRTCVAVNAELMIIGKPAFSLDQAEVKRAGLNHWNQLKLTQFSGYAEFIRKTVNRRKIMLSKSADCSLWDFQFLKNDILIFGNESRGLPPAMLSRADVVIRIDMWGPVRSLNLSNSVAIVLYEFLRQQSKHNQLEWEKAARGVGLERYWNTKEETNWVPRENIYPTGNEFNPEVCITSESHKDGPVDVDKLKDSSPFQVYGMCGNAAEWTSSWLMPYRGNYKQSPDWGARFKVIRGGSWDLPASFARSFMRLKGGLPSLSQDYRAGFRCALDIK